VCGFNVNPIISIKGSPRLDLIVGFFLTETFLTFELLWIVYV